MTDHASPDRAALIAEAKRLLADITPGEDWNVEEDTEDLLDEYIGRVRREGCCCGTNDPADPWCEGHEPEQRVFHVEGPRKINIEDLGEYYAEADAKFIAAAPRLLRALLAVVREGEQEKARYENAQCITCARDLDALASRASAPEGQPREEPEG